MRESNAGPVVETIESKVGTKYIRVACSTLRHEDGAIGRRRHPRMHRCSSGANQPDLRHICLQSSAFSFLPLHPLHSDPELLLLATVAARRWARPTHTPRAEHPAVRRLMRRRLSFGATTE